MMSVVRRFDDERFFKRAIVALIGVLVISVVSFAAYYYFDRYYAVNTPIADREISQVTKMVKNDPSNLASRLTLAALYLRKGSYQDAVTQYNEVLKVDDKNLGALIGLGMSYYRSGKLKESAAALQQVADITKDDDPAQHTSTMGSVHYYLGMIAQTQGDLQRSEDELKKSLLANRTDSDTIIALSGVVLQLGRADEAIQGYLAALQFVPNYREAYEGLAKAYAAAGKTTEAAYATAMVEYCKGSYDAAISQLNPVVSARPDFAEAYYGLGAAYDKKGNRDQAIAAYQKAIELNPDYQAAQVGLSRLGGEMPASAKPAAGH